MPASNKVFDVVVIGGGPAGEHAIGRLRHGGLSAALVETELVGGECSYWACMPSKTLLRPGTVLAAVHKVPGAVQAVTGELDAQAALARRNWMTADWNDAGQQEWVESSGATLFRGHGKLVGERLVEVTRADSSIRIEARKAVILATGSSSVVPPIEGLGATRYWDNRGATAATTVPERLVALGGGVVGVELAQAFHRLGSREVTIVEGGPRLVANAEPFASELLAKALIADGIIVRTSTRAKAVARDHPDAPLQLTLEDGTVIDGDELLVAVGRRPRTEGIGIELFGLDAQHAVAVDEVMRVEGVPGEWLYAIGDVNGRALLTHMGKYHARVAVDAIRGRQISASAAVPSVIFTDPEIAAVGLTEAQARDEGHDVVIARTPLESTPAAEIAGTEVSGACQLVIDATRHIVLGATFVGPALSEAIHAATVAIAGEVTIERLRHAVPSFPTFAEVWIELIDTALETAS